MLVRKREMFQVFSFQRLMQLPIQCNLHVRHFLAMQFLTMVDSGLREYYARPLSSQRDSPCYCDVEIQTASAKILNKHSRTADKGWFS